jgi:DNA-binding transcriptional MerR regulator
LNQFDKKSLTKLYYTIGEVSTMFNVNSSLIRFWEKEFGVLHPKKNKKGNRLFTPDDIELFNKIYQLVKEQGFTLEGAKNVLKKKSVTSGINTDPNSSHERTDENVIQKLEEIKAKLLILKRR